MNLKQILKELNTKFKHRDQKGLLRALDRIPDIYPFLNEQQVLILQTEYPKLKTKIEACKWLNLTQKMIEQISPKERAKKMIRQLRGEPEPRNIDDDIKAFINLLLRFEWEESQEEKEGKGMPLAEANLKLRPIIKKDPHITAKSAAELVGCSESTIVNTDAWKSVKENLKRGRKPKAQRLTDTRQKITPVEDAELRKLIDEQEKDALEDAEPKQGKKQRRRYPSV